MEKITLEVKGNNPGHYTPGIIAGGMLYISGQLSLNPDTREVASGGIEAHMTLALQNVERVLHAAGLTREDVVQCRVYLTDIEHWQAANQIYAKFFGAHKPARVIVPVSSLHFGCLAEIEAIAEVK